MLVRFTAVALISLTAVELALYLVISQHNQTPVSFLACFMKSLPLVAGVVMLIKARALAEWIADKMDL